MSGTGTLVELGESRLIEGELKGLDIENFKQLEKWKLVEQARKGDQEAFNELVRMHRAKAHGWAYSVAKDTFLAEDIVQEALFRAFIKLGTLLDTNKFTPWLKQIVRNEAYMKMRIASYKMESSLSSQPTQHKEPTVDWGDIDQVLSFLSYKASEKSRENNPEEYMMRLSVVDGICSLLKCLSKRDLELKENNIIIADTEAGAIAYICKKNDVEFFCVRKETRSPYSFCKALFYIMPS
ncbi:hypothetical protein KJK41_04980 [Bacillus haikouensis]|nr:hypothetical protein KJK41_04980 [Bacillus haikouensis]